ncbi:5,10-methylenetetrahydromethanopterin reductase [Nakamurella panacisegetis]|uniref:5,10-methylenetetrahydromethanopterin reductase n=1 Tax=Nakamurella panacisegetis TaxID=1090615 RepID=A0A1H0MWW5_9ACTN|nr:LLM class flavin-dependent oxidoreductase [Nakamurella panacisegetis]SDO84913.1 5,10-methylenetetrahydromethanopterin reductase [Nakamurella panacisegetis]
MTRGPRRVEIGLGLQSDKPVGQYARLAVLAESYGFDVVSVFGDLLFQPPIVPLLEMARSTTRVRLGAACWNPFTQHPYEIAGQWLALDAASDGRAYLGLARGTWLGAIGVAQPRPAVAVEEAIGVISALVTGDDSGRPGDLFSLAPGVRLRYPTSGRRPPVLIGTWGPRLAAVAGRIADEVKIGGTANPATVGVMRERIAVGRMAAGRPAEAVGVVVGAVTVVDRDGVAARRRARTEVAMYLAVVADLDPTVQLEPALLGEINRLVDLGRHGAAGELVPDDVLDLFAFSGTPEQVAAQAQALIDAGASRVEFGTPHGLTDQGGVALLGAEVLPLLRR